MSEEICGKVTPAERDEMRSLHQRKLALSELASTISRLPSDDAQDRLYERIVADMGATLSASSDWWAVKSSAYGWARAVSWRLDFETCAVYLRRE